MKITKTETGLYLPEHIPTDEEREAARKQFFKDYNMAHQCCPVCGGFNIACTTAAWIRENRDHNHANCQDCGWHGIVDDLKPGQ